MEKVRSVIVIGLDGAMPYFLKKFVEEGYLPNFEKVMSEGVFAEAIPCPPTDTPTNWTTIATGATTGTHGVTSFYLHLPGEPLPLGQRLRHRSQLAKYCKAEYLWEVASKLGILSLVVNYPSGWTNKVKNCIMVSGSWHMPTVPPKIITESAIYSSKPTTNEQPMKTIEVPKEGVLSPIKFEIELKGGIITRPLTLEIQAISISRKEYDAIAVVYQGSKYVVKKGKWSEWIYASFQTSHGTLKGMFRVKLLEISSDGKFVKLQTSRVFTAEKWIYPQEYSERLIKNQIIPIGALEELTPEEKELTLNNPELVHYAKEAKALVKLITYFKREVNWKVCFLHYHLFDGVNHLYLGYLHKECPAYTEEKCQEAWEIMKRAYQIADRFVGQLIEKCTSKDSLVVIVSDHAAIPTWKMISLRKVLIDAGLLSYKWDDSIKKYRVDLKKTKAYPYYEPTYIWVNLEGREPEGVVKSSEYEEVRDEIINALRSAKDPETKECPIELVVRKEDDPYLKKSKTIAETVGDVIYYLKPPYQFWDGDISILTSEFMSKEEMEGPFIWYARKIFGTHAYYLPTARVGNFTISGIFLMKGPNVAKGLELKEPINLTDVTPTIAHLMQIPLPKQSEGRILHEALI